MARDDSRGPRSREVRGTVHTSPVVLVGGTGFLGAQTAMELMLRGLVPTLLGRSSGPTLARPNRYIQFNVSEADGKSLPELADATVVDFAVGNHHEFLNDQVSRVNGYSGDFEPYRGWLQSLKRSGIARYIFVSSGGALYAPDSCVSSKESDDQRPLSVYGQAKLKWEHCCVELQELGIPVTVLRVANAYGPGQVPTRSHGIVEKAIWLSLLGRPLVMRAALTDARDFVYSSDVARGVADVIQMGSGGVINLGTGHATRMEHLLDIVSKAIHAEGRSLEILWELPPEPRTRYSALDSSEACRRLGWSAEVSLESGVVMTMAPFLGLELPPRSREAKKMLIEQAQRQRWRLTEGVLTQ